MRETIIGIIGGMGPAATAKFYNDLVARTPATCDQDHYHVIVDGNVKIADRTAYIFGDGPSPLDALIKTAKRLACCGVGVAAIPCMTAHYFYDDIAAAVDYPIVHAMRETNHYIKAHYQVKRVGILCTDGTRQMQLFDKHLEAVELLYPSSAGQARVMQAIYGAGGIKAGQTTGRPTELLAAVAADLVASGAELIVAGCTEIPLALQQQHVTVPLIDALAVTIEKLLTYR